MNNTVTRGHIVVLAAVLIILGAVIWTQFLPSNSPAEIQIARLQTENQLTRSVFVEGEGIDIDELAMKIKEVDFNYSEERSTRNPMKPLVGGINTSLPQPSIAKNTEQTAIPNEDLAYNAGKKQITAIVFGKNPMAVVDNEVVQLGHQFGDGITVESIENNRVILRAGNALVPVDLGR
jgi:hypothetical protein